MMINVAIGIGLLLSWCIIVMAPAAKLAYEDHDLPEDKRRGVSVFPGLPFMPLLVGVLAYSANRFISAWIALVILSANVVLTIWAVVYIVYWLRRLTKLPNKASDATSEPAPGAASSAHQG